MPRAPLASSIALLLALTVAAAAPAAVPVPVLEGPVTGGLGSPFVAGTTFDLAEVGYEQEEFFMSGTAAAYTSDAALTPDGAWSATRSALTADYKTRILVYRPIEPKKFKGTVLVEWLNVSGGLDAAPDWLGAHTEMIRDGMIWVGVSAQIVGIEGGVSIPGIPPLGLKTVDPVRYASLVHPGDTFSYDIFSQAAAAIRTPGAVDPLRGRVPRHVIAIGESQSAFRMVTYVDAVQPLEHLFDGFLVHSRGGGGADLSQDPQPVIPAASPTLIRDDVDVPVLTFQTETDLLGLGFLGARQPDTDRHRTWEVAGTAHADTYTIATGMTDQGDDPGVAALVVTTTPIAFIECSSPINSGPQHWVLDAAIAALDRWVRRGKVPPVSPRLEIDPGPPAAFVRDADGNATGGIRAPQLDAPIATLSGQGQTGAGFCFLFGTTVPFDDATLAARYPKKNSFKKAFGKATVRAQRAGFLRKPDAKLLRAWAKTAGIGG